MHRSRSGTSRTARAVPRRSRTGRHPADARLSLSAITSAAGGMPLTAYIGHASLFPSLARWSPSRWATAVDGNDGGRHNDVVTGTDLLELVSSDPATCHGQPCIKGTRVLVTVILDALAAGLASDEIVRHYPTLTQEGVRAAAAYGAWLAKQEIHVLPVA